jgi:uncharacterized protein DUF6496
MKLVKHWSAVLRTGSPRRVAWHESCYNYSVAQSMLKAANDFLRPYRRDKSGQLFNLRLTSATAGFARLERRNLMAKYGAKASAKVKKAMHERKKGTLKSGRSGKKVTSRKQAIAIGLSEARRAGGKVPRKKSRKK